MESRRIEVREELELFSPNKNGDHKDALLWGIGEHARG